jgi:hypothetical protein
LVRLSDSLFFAPQSDSEKKKKRHSKELREKRPNPGSFWFTAPYRRIFFSATQELQSGKFGLGMKKMAHIKPILCVFGMLFCSSGYTAPEMHHQQANVIQTTRTGAWPVCCVADLVGASSLAHTPVSFRSPAQHTKQGKHAKSKQK